MITPSSLEALKAKIDIVDVIGSYLELKKNGGNFKACCPLHGEKTPSFVVSSRKQIYHCFGCGAGGDAIKFVQEYKNLSFVEACEEIAEQYNFALQHENNQNSKATDHKRLLEAMSRFYEQNLSEEHREYLHKRGVSDESIAKFGIGYAGRTDAQIKHLTQNFFSLQDAVEVGILANDGERRYARFINRIVFPITSHTDKIVGFSGRILEGDGAKYLNSPATCYFDKSRLFYGYGQAKDAIYSKGTIVVAEGQIDVVMLHQAGIKTAVATLGTALTEHHIPLIKKANARVLLAYDGDSAGVNAAFKAAVLLSQHEVDGGVVLFPQGLDPADMVAQGRVEELISILKKPSQLVKFVLEHITLKYNLQNPYDKNRAIADGVEFLKTLPSLIVANEFAGYLAALLGVSSQSITLGQTRIEAPVNFAGENRAKLKLQKSMLEYPHFVDVALDIVEYEALVQCKVDEALVRGKLEDDALFALKVREDIEPYTYDEFVKACKLLQKGHIRQKIEVLKNSSDVSMDIFVQMSKLQRELRG
jgi:DNA primase